MTTLRMTALVALLAVLGGCAWIERRNEGRVTDRDRTKKGAAIGAASGAVLGAVLGEGEADEILAGALIGAGIGAGVGAYMDRQQEKLAQLPGTSVERLEKNMLLVHFESDLLFNVDSSSLGGGARGSLDKAATVFNEHPKTAIVCQGHTDSSGSEAYNQGLSERRATAVMNHLIGLGVDPGRIVSLGYGEDNPIADNGTSYGRTANRRVDLLLKAKVR